MEEHSEEQLVARSCKGDKKAYAQLVKLHAGRVFAVCLGMLGNEADAEDISQDTLIKGFTQVGRLRKPDQFASWIARVAQNHCVDFIRRKQRGREALAQRVREPREPTELRSDLHQAIGQLPESYRVPLMLYYFDGQSTASVARTLELTAECICTRLSRARKALRELLSQEEKDHV